MITILLLLACPSSKTDTSDVTDTGGGRTDQDCVGALTLGVHPVYDTVEESLQGEGYNYKLDIKITSEEEYLTLCCYNQSENSDYEAFRNGGFYYYDGPYTSTLSIYMGWDDVGGVEFLEHSEAKPETLTLYSVNEPTCHFRDPI